MSERNSIVDLQLLMYVRNQDQIDDEDFDRAMEEWTRYDTISMVTVLRELGLVKASRDLSWTDTLHPHTVLSRATQHHEFLDPELSQVNSSTTVSRAQEFVNQLEPIESRFEILKQISRGGSSEIFEAWHPELARFVALKVHTKKDESSRDLIQFLNEACITAQLEHPNVPSVYGFGTLAEGRPCIALELLSGRTLSHEILDFHAGSFTFFGLELHRLLEILGAACSAADQAHRSGFVHRDIKPSNILVGAHGELYLADWGLAKPVRPYQESEVNTKKASGNAHEISGTPPFVCPERLGNPEVCNPQVDVYSLGVTMYHVLTGCLPFHGERTQGVIPVLVRPRAINHRIPVALEAICLKAMATEPAQRYPTARGLLEDLEAWRRGVPLAIGDPLSFKFRRFFRRNFRAITASSFLLVVALSALLVLARYKRNQVVMANRAVEVTRQAASDANELAADEKARAMQGLQEIHELIDDLLVLNSQAYNCFGIQVNSERSKQLLTQAKDYYVQFLNNDANLNSANRLCDIRFQLANVLTVTGDLKSAESEAIECAKYYSTRIESEDSELLNRKLAESYHLLAQVYWLQGRLESAKEYGEQAVELKTKLAKRLGRRVDLSELASKSLFGNILNAIGESDAAETVLNEVIVQLGGEAERGDETDQRVNYILTLQNAGVLAIGLDDFSRAKALFKKANYELTEVLRQQPDDLKLQYWMARSMTLFCACQLKSGDSKDVLETLRSAEKKLDQLIDQDATNVGLKNSWIETQYWIAVALNEVKSTEEAFAQVKRIEGFINNQDVENLANFSGQIILGSITTPNSEVSQPDHGADHSIQLEIAKLACELTDWKDPNYLEAVAETYASLHDFENAVKFQTKALALANSDQQIESMEKCLQAYRASNLEGQDAGNDRP